jgi:hypothetical protein
LNALIAGIQGKYQIVEQDNFLNSPKIGYRGVHLQVLLPGHISAELQLLPTEIATVQDQAHKAYEALRTTGVSTADYQAASAKSQAIFDAAWAQFQARSGMTPSTKQEGQSAVTPRRLSRFAEAGGATDTSRRVSLPVGSGAHPSVSQTSMVATPSRSTMRATRPSRRLAGHKTVAIASSIAGGIAIGGRLLTEFNPNHEPAGSAEGGQFTSGDSGGVGNGKGASAAQPKIPAYIQGAYDKIKSEYEADLGTGKKTQAQGDTGCLNGFCLEVSQELASRLRDSGHEAYARRYSQTPDKKAEGGDYGGHWTVVTPAGEFDPTITHWSEPRPNGITYDQSLYPVTAKSPHAKWTVDPNTKQESRSVAIGGRLLQEFNPNHVASGPDGGQFTSGDGGGGGSKVAQPNPGSLSERLRSPDGGFTYDAKTGQEPTSGYVVSAYPDRSKLITGIDGMTADALASRVTDYVIANMDLISQADHQLGGWHDPKNGKVYLDVVQVKSTAAEAESVALAHDQIAYYDIKAGKSVDVNRSAKSGQA